MAAKQFSPFLHAWHDPLAGLKVHSSCVKLADLDCDGDSKLCICDLDKKLKIYKGTTLAVEYAILDTPVAMCIIYSEATMVNFVGHREYHCIKLIVKGNYLLLYSAIFPLFYLSAAANSFHCSSGWRARVHLPSTAPLPQGKLICHRL